MAPTARARAWGLKRLLFVALVTLVAAAYVLWSLYVLDWRVTYQIELTGHPFAISDLYPRWLGAKALLAGQDPYSAGFTAELHRQYYGRVMNPAEEMALFRNICEFFYPVFVALPLLPLLWLPFEVARWAATLGLVAAIAGCVWMWLGLLGVESRRVRLLAAVGSVAFYPSLDLILLQQLTGLVLLHLVAGYVLAARRHFAVAGALLALAMIKPQGAAIPAGALLIWALWRRERWPLVGWFGAVMAAQLAFAQIVLPGWLGEFLQASVRYQRYNTISLWLPGQVLGSDGLGAVLIAVPLLSLLCALWWKHRAEDASAPSMVRLMALTFAASVVLMPDISFYNKTFLLPALLVILADHHPSAILPRLARRFAIFAVATPVLLLAVAGTLYWLSAPLNLQGVRAFAPPLTDSVQSFLMLLPLLVLPGAITQCLSSHPERESDKVAVSATPPFRLAAGVTA